VLKAGGLGAEATVRRFVLTDAVQVLPEGLSLASPARLKLRLRDRDPALLAEAIAHPERLRVFVFDSAAKEGRALPAPVTLIEVPGGTGASFEVAGFGRFLVALER
jgi:hypothetical protein